MAIPKTKEKVKPSLPITTIFLNFASQYTVLCQTIKQRCIMEISVEYFKQMQIQDLYDLETSEETFDLDDFWPHVYDIDILGDVANKRVKIKVIVKIKEDYHSYWQLASVWFDDKPFGIIQNAGREGQDHVEEFWTDKETYLQALYYLRSLIPINATIPVHESTYEDLALIQFYGKRVYP